MSNLTDEQIEAERRAIVKACVQQMITEGAAISHSSVSVRLEKTHPGFHYVARQDDFRARIDDTIPEEKTVEPVVGEIAAIEPTDTAEQRSGARDQSAAAEPDFHPMDIELLRAAIHEAEMERGALKSQLYAAAAARTIGRTILASAIQAFISGRPSMTATELARSFCAGAAEDRAKAKAVGLDRVPAGAVNARSVLDRQLAYASGGDASDRVRSTMRVGHRRGALSQANASRANQERVFAAAAAAKLAR